MKFIKHQSKTVDVFCFQEVFRSSAKRSRSRYRHTLFADLVRALPDFRGRFCSVQRGYSLEGEGPVDYALALGLAMFVRKRYQFRTGHAFIFRHRDAAFDCLPGKSWKGKSAHDPSFVRLRRKHFRDELLRSFPEALQYAVLAIGTKRMTVAHLQGLWYPGTKLDTPERLAQSRKIIETLARLPGKKVLCGDFNLMPNTESIQMLERMPLRNLITEFSIADTRGPIAHAQYPDNPQYYADYAFVSRDVPVKKFDVPNVSVSDHLPLILTIGT